MAAKKSEKLSFWYKQDWKNLHLNQVIKKFQALREIPTLFQYDISDIIRESRFFFRKKKSNDRNWTDYDKQRHGFSCQLSVQCQKCHLKSRIFNNKGKKSFKGRWNLPNSSLATFSDDFLMRKMLKSYTWKLFSFFN